jgi:hypothetical protein
VGGGVVDAGSGEATTEELGGVVGNAGLVSGVVLWAEGRSSVKALRAVLANGRIGTGAGVAVGGVEATGIGGDVWDGHSRRHDCHRRGQQDELHRSKKKVDFIFSGNPIQKPGGTEASRTLHTPLQTQATALFDSLHIRILKI